MTASLFDEQPEPVRPYWQDEQPSSGWSGSDTSKGAEPVRLQAQQRVWLALRDAGVKGLTWQEAADTLNGAAWESPYPAVHHGTVSGALTNLHQAGHAARLTEKRLRRKVYVLPSYVGGRATEAPTAQAESRRGLAKRAFLAGRASSGIGYNNLDEFAKWWESHG